MRKRICFIMMDLQLEINHKISEGIAAQANALGYDVYNFSYMDNRNEKTPNILGEENILSLIDTSRYDGFIVRKGSFSKQEIRERIDRLCTDSGKPFIDLDDTDDKDEIFPLWNDRDNFRMMTEHLLKVHGFRKIYCVTGFKDVHQSMERLAGYRDALISFGIKPKAEWEFYGDFWVEHACNLADKIAKGEIEQPEAIAFASTTSANAFAERLQKHGMSVPDDIAVTGYDCYRESILGAPTITIVSGINYKLGVNAVCRLHRKITGEIADTIPVPQESISTGSSCGCSAEESETSRWYKRELSAQLEYNYRFQFSGMFQSISSTSSADKFFPELVNFCYLIRGVEAVWLCLNNDWDGINNLESETYRTEGYAEQIYVYKYQSEKAAYSVSTLNELLMAGIHNENYPGMYYLYPLHYNDRCFGFFILHFRDNCYAPDDIFKNWLDCVSNSLETIRMRYYVSRFSDRDWLAAVRDPLTGTYNRRGFEEISAEMLEQAVIYTPIYCNKQ